MITIGRYALVFLAIVLMAVSCDNKKPGFKKKSLSLPGIIQKKEISVEFIDTLAIDTFLLKNPYYRVHRESIHDFYKRRGYNLAWSEKGILLPQANMFLNIVINLDKHGLVIDIDESNRIKNLYSFIAENRKPYLEEVSKARKELDISMTGSFFKHAPQMWSGVLDPSDVKLEWYTEPKKITYDEKLDSILNLSGKSNPFLEIEPQHVEYQNLKKSLAKYRLIQRSGGWPQIDGGEKSRIAKGDRGPEVAKLKKRLLLEGDLERESEGDLFDIEVKNAVKKYQNRYGLPQNGVVRDKTLEELNKPVSERINQIILNMERWRWVPEKISDNYIFVNIPEFKLHVLEEGQEKWSMNVIVGKEATKTPIFNDEIDHIVFSPTWTVPHSIAVDEFLPAIKRNSNYLSKKNMQLYDWHITNPIDPRTINWDTIDESNFNFRIQQNPGWNNALGRVKFMFPNRFSVYLHDTPYGYLFSESERGFSHGCIRVEDPSKLAAYLLREDKSWTQERIEKAMNSSEEIYVTLKKPVPVYLVYFTTWADPDGTVHFRDDFYKHDKTLSEYFYKELYKKSQEDR